MTVKKTAHWIYRVWRAALDLSLRQLKKNGNKAQMGRRHLPFLSRKSVGSIVSHDFDTISARIQTEIRRQEEQTKCKTLCSDAAGTCVPECRNYKP